MSQARWSAAPPATARCSVILRAITVSANALMTLSASAMRASEPIPSARLSRQLGSKNRALMSDCAVSNAAPNSDGRRSDSRFSPKAISANESRVNPKNMAWRSTTAPSSAARSRSSQNTLLWCWNTPVM
eukprot:Amastigsp_a178387_34.p4 type:complete len:130 gc:universal Amastigsp_a178387_34:671-1060(+)